MIQTNNISKLEQERLIPILTRLEQVKCESCNQFPQIDIIKTIKSTRNPNIKSKGIVFSSICCEAHKTKINDLFLKQNLGKANELAKGILYLSSKKV